MDSPVPSSCHHKSARTGGAHLFSSVLPVACHPYIAMLLRDVEMLRLTQPLKYPPTAPCLPEMELQVLKGLPSLQRLPACLPWALCVCFPFTGPHYTHSSHRRTLSSSLAPPTTHVAQLEKHLAWEKCIPHVASPTCSYMER